MVGGEREPAELTALGRRPAGSADELSEGRHWVASWGVCGLHESLEFSANNLE